MIFWDAHAGLVFSGVPLPSAPPPRGWRCPPAGAEAGRAEQGARSRSRIRRAGRGWARSCRGSAGPRRAPAGAVEQMAPAGGGRLAFVALSFAHMLRTGGRRGRPQPAEGAGSLTLNPNSDSRPWERASALTHLLSASGGNHTLPCYSHHRVTRMLSPILQLEN